MRGLVTRRGNRRQWKSISRDVQSRLVAHRVDRLRSASATSANSRGEVDVKLDLVIRGGTIVDGTGVEPVEGDIGIAGDRIAAVGTVDGVGREEIDARGLIVTPGFIDVHTHLDAQITWDPLGSPSNFH